MSTILAANINADGTVAQNPTGGIRTVQKGSEQGTYNIVFSTPFVRPPVVVATQNYPSWNSALSDHGWPGDNAVIIYVNETSVGILTGQSNKTSPRNFSVLIVGNTST